MQRSFRAKEPEVEVIITGRKVPEELITIADLVSKIKLVKHPFNREYLLDEDLNIEMEKKVRGIRGATVVEKDDKEEIKKAAKELFDLLLRENNISPSEIVAVFITATPDLHSHFSC